MEKKHELQIALVDWVNKVLKAYDNKEVSMTNTLQMIVDVDKIVADAFNHDRVFE